MTVELIEIQGRGLIHLIELPTAANGFAALIEFGDRSPASSATYIAQLNFDIVTEAPDPGGMGVLALSLIAFMAIRRSRNKV